MPDPSRDTPDAFRALERRLAARRIAALGTRDRVMLGLLGLNTLAFAYWLVHGPLMGRVHARGPLAGLAMLAIALAAIAIAGGAGAAWRRASMAARPPGPEWLALPVPPERVSAHLRSEARWTAAIALVPGLGVLLAAPGLVPALWLLPAALGFVALWFAATQAGCAIAWRVRLPRASAGRVLPPATRALLTAPRVRWARTIAAPRWRSEPAWRALARLDARVSRRGAAPRARLLWAALGLAAGIAAWFAPAPPLTRRALAFVAFAPASVMMGTWALVRTCGPAEVVLRPLPVGLRDVWRARAAVLAAFALAAGLVNAALAMGFPPAARVGTFVTWVLPGFAIALLGLHYALTLGRRAAAAEGLYVAWLAIAVIASVMIPLLGWGVLIAGLVHSSLRLPRWWQSAAEEA